MSAAARFWHRQRTTLLTILAMVMAGAGAWLSISPEPVAVSIGADGVRVGGSLLAPSSGNTAGASHVYTGDAALALVTTSSHQSTGAAVMTWNGRPATGRCVLSITPVGSAVESCTFDVGGVATDSSDQFDAGQRAWHRRYSDGMTVAIAVPSGSPLIPIPFPLGR